MSKCSSLHPLACSFRAINLCLGFVALTTAGQTPPVSPDSTSDIPVQLTPFSVTEQHEVGYGALYNSASGRLNQSYLDIAQTASIVTSEFLADANLNSAMDALNFVPNVQVQGSAHTGATYTIRGQYVGDPTMDGFVVADAANFDTYFADRIEVVKGPTDPSFGTSGPGGFINFVSKLPTFATPRSWVLASLPETASAPASRSIRTAWPAPINRMRTAWWRSTTAEQARDS